MSMDASEQLKADNVRQAQSGLVDVMRNALRSVGASVSQAV